MKDTTIKFQALDALRGIAALAVAVFHFSGDWAGYLAVDFFLVLSGFILSHSYLYKESVTPPIAFISHRLARLYPLHIFTLFTFILVSIIAYGDLRTYADGNIFTFIQQLTFTQNIGLNPSGITYNFPSWSISVEFWVNILFIFFITKSTKSATLFLISIAGLILIYGNTGHLDTHAKNYYGFVNSGLIRGLSSFLLGILSYRIYLFFKDDTRIIKYINIFEIFGLIAIGLIVAGRSDKLSGLDVFAPIVFMFVVAIFTVETGLISKCLKSIRYLGEMSYSIYLNQITVLVLVRYLLQDYQLLLPFQELFTYLIALLIYSHFTYQFIEKPLRKKGRNVLAKIVDVRK